MERERYTPEDAAREASVLSDLNQEAGIEYQAANDLVDNTELAQKILEYQEQTQKDLARVREKIRTASTDQSTAEFIEDQESLTASEIRKILDKSQSAIYTGMDGAGHKEYLQGAGGRFNAGEGSVYIPASMEIFGGSLRADQTSNQEAWNVAYKELDKSEPGQREKVFITNSSKVVGDIRISYIAKGGETWLDQSGRSGQQLLVFCELPKTEAFKLIDLVQNNPTAIRESAKQIVLERIGIDNETWQSGSDRTSGSPLRPPYEIWDSEPNASIFLSSQISELSIPVSGERIRIQN